MPKQGKGPLRIAFEDFWQTYLTDGIGKSIKTKLLVVLRGKLTGTLKEILNGVGAEDSARLITNIIDDMDEDDALTYVLTVVPMLISLLFTMISSSFFAVPMLLVTYAQNRIFEPYRADISSYVNMGFRNPGNIDRFKAEASDLGIPSDMYDFFTSIYKPLLPPTELMLSLNRKLIDEPTFREKLSAQGWDADAIEVFFALRFIIPPVTDMIHFAVREAFDDEVAAKFGYDKNFPVDISPFAKQAGISDEWLKRYWRAHWVLPSPTQGYEMLHRLRPSTSSVPFTADDLELLLRASDVPDFYRKRLIEISYSVLTRVDIRRMRRLGELDKDGVFKAYLDGGYNEENAQLLTNFVEKEFGEDRRELTRTQIERAYDLGLLSRDEAITKLDESGYPRTTATFIIDLVDLRNAEEDIRDNINFISERYLRGVIDETTMRSDINVVGITVEKQQSITEKLLRLREGNERFPTTTNFKQMFGKAIITETEFRSELARMNFNPTNIDRLIELWS